MFTQWETLEELKENIEALKVWEKEIKELKQKLEKEYKNHVHNAQVLNMSD